MICIYLLYMYFKLILQIKFNVYMKETTETKQTTRTEWGNSFLSKYSHLHTYRWPDSKCKSMIWCRSWCCAWWCIRTYALFLGTLQNSVEYVIFIGWDALHLVQYSLVVQFKTGLIIFLHSFSLLTSLFQTAASFSLFLINTVPDPHLAWPYGILHPSLQCSLKDSPFHATLLSKYR